MEKRNSALKFIDKFIDYEYNKTCTGEVGSLAKRSALVAIDEVIFNINITMLYLGEDKVLKLNMDYWVELKEEIKKL